MKLADFSLNNKIKNCNINFLTHTKYFLAVILAIVISAVFVVSFVGFKADVDFAGGTILTTVVTEDIDNSEVYNNTKKMIEEIAYNNNVQISSFSTAETNFGDAIVVKLFNKNAEVNNQIVSQINEKLGYDSADVLEKNYVTADVYNETASQQTKMSAVALSVAIVLIFVYILFRYNLLSSLVYIISVLGEIVAVLAITIICRIPVNASISTGIIAIFAVSSLLKLVLLNKIKTNSKIDEFKQLSKHDQMILADKQIFVVLCIVCIISLIALVLFAGLGSLQIRAVAIPTLAGVIISALTTFYVTPYLYEKINIKNRFKK